MKKIYLLLFLLVSISGFGQNYQTIKSNQINYFGNHDLSYILATRTDSIELDGADSIFYSFKTMRENDTATTSSCVFIKTYPWIGAKVIIKADGQNLFFNKNLDTIKIETQAVLNDTFLIYQYPSGKSIKGWISQHDTMTVLGSFDSVKTIKLFSTDTVFHYQDSTLLIGKQNGFIRNCPFYSFPDYYPNIGQESGLNLIGSEFPRLGITKRTKEEIYEMEIGDVVQWNRSTIHWSGPYSEYHNEKLMVVDKSIWGLDSIHIEFERDWRNKYWYNGSPINTSGSAIQGFFKAYELSEYLNDFLPEEIYVHDLNNQPHFRSNSMYVTICDRISEGYLPWNLQVITDSIGNVIDSVVCYSDPGFYPATTVTYEYIEGLGGSYWFNGMTYDGFGHSHFGGINHFTNQGETCGTQWYLGLPEEIDPSINLYPNPAINEIYINLGHKLAQGELMITDLSGKIVQRELINSDLTTLDVSDLPSGIYVVTVVLGDDVYTKKLIKH